MRILGIERDLTACNYYRILNPLAKLDEHELAEVTLINSDQFADDVTVQKVLWADVIVVPRPADENWFKFLKLCRREGKIIVSDYDDDPFNTSPLNPYYRFNGIEPAVHYKWPDGEVEVLWQDGMPDQFGNPNWYNVERNMLHRDMFRLNFKKSDLVTCTTDILREAFLKINPNVKVLPNALDLDVYPQLDCVKKEIRIGWQGGVSHYEDLWMVKDAITKLLKKHKNVKFVYFGDSRFFGLFKDAPKDQFEFINWTKHNAYSYRLATLNLDIGICPLWDNEFNRNKSAIKFFEYAAVGAATVASNIPPYSPVMEHGKNGLLCGPEDWYEALESLVMDRKKIKKLANSAYETVKENHNIDKEVHLWAEAYDELIKGESCLTPLATNKQS